MMSDTLPSLVGHRGARGEAPENTLPSFQIAMDQGLRAIELDVRLSRDGTLIVLHDPTLLRTTGVQGIAHQWLLEDLKRLDARQNTPGWPVPVSIPTLQEVVSLCAPETQFQFEVKGGEDSRYLQLAAKSLAALIEYNQMANRTIVTSSDPRFLTQMHAVDGQQARGLVCEKWTLNPVKKAQKLGCEWVIPHFSLVTPTMMAKARQAGLSVSTWTVNDLMEADRLTALGVDSIITDYATGFSAHFSARQQRNAG